MKFEFFKKLIKSEKKPAARKSSGRVAPSRARSKKTSRRSNELPDWGKSLLKAGIYLVLVLGLCFGLYQAFRSYYFKSSSLFVVKDTDENVVIDTGKTLTPDLIKQFLGIKEGVNLFSINVDEKRKQLMERAPSIKDISIVRHMPDSLKISIIEREPVVRIGLDGRVSDDEGVVFVRYQNTSGLPVITRSTGKTKAKPGDKLQGMDLAAVKLAGSTFRPECKARIYSIDSSKPRYLLLKFPDGREATIAWKDMDECSSTSNKKMILQYDRLISCMESEIGAQHRIFDAQHPGRIYGRSINFVE